MELPVAEWHRAVFVRRSRRSFSIRPIPAALKNRLNACAAQFRPFPEVRAIFVDREPESVLKGAVGSYGRITGAPAYAAFIGDESAPSVREGIGYTGEGFILSATDAGLGTCWVSGFFRPEAVGRHIELRPGERVFAVTPVGFAADALTAKDRVYRALARSNGRKPLSGIVRGEVPRPWQRSALEAARLAPSAGNRQPWRFNVEPDAIAVETNGRRDSDHFPKRLDCGIAMLHLELGARAAGAAGRWEPLFPPSLARYKIIV